MKNLKGLVEESYKCPQCGFVFPIWRKRSKVKEKEHRKYLWCPNCSEEERINFIKI